ncbi:MAG TPA: glycosyltransferase family 2 protein [Candidatus Limnocylindria bacterium]|nr:glycosyltransferase family 2 protein [Candidatus Limnocylindria bacterium]
MPARLDGLSFFFPALNEEDHVGAMVSDALAILPRFADDIDVTIVDDGSTDRTGAIADDLAAKDPRVHVIHHGTRRGYGGAVRSGLSAATKPWVFYTDGDRQFDLADLERLISVSDGVDAVVGYREKRADPPRRLFVAWVYNRLIRVLFGGGWRDVDCAFKLFRRDVFARVPLERVRANGAFFSPELLITLRRAGVRIRQVGVRHFPRTAGEEKGASPRVILRAIRDLGVLRMRLWLRPND